MKFTTTTEIEEVETEVVVYFNRDIEEGIEITCICDLDGNELEIDEYPAHLYSECHDFVSGVEADRWGNTSY